MWQSGVDLDAYFEQLEEILSQADPSSEVDELRRVLNSVHQEDPNLDTIEYAVELMYKLRDQNRELSQLGEELEHRVHIKNDDTADPVKQKHRNHYFENRERFENSENQKFEL